MNNNPAEQGLTRADILYGLPLTVAIIGMFSLIGLNGIASTSVIEHLQQAHTLSQALTTFISEAPVVGVIGALETWSHGGQQMMEIALAGAVTEAVAFGVRVRLRTT